MSRKLLMVLYRKAYVILPVLIIWQSCGTTNSTG